MGIVGEEVSGQCKINPNKLPRGNVRVMSVARSPWRECIEAGVGDTDFEKTE